MRKTTLPVNGGAVTKPDRSAIMARAWVILRAAYGDSPNALKRNRRKASFGYCVMLAWQGAKAAPKNAVAERVGAGRVLASRRCVPSRVKSSETQAGRTLLEQWPAFKRSASAVRDQARKISKPFRTILDERRAREQKIEIATPREGIAGKLVQQQGALSDETEESCLDRRRRSKTETGY